MRMAILSSAKKEKDPVWLRVVSVAPDTTSAGTAAERGRTPEMKGHKRRRSSDAAILPTKMRKTDTGPVHVSEYGDNVVIGTLTQNPIQVCPEYLAQHEEPELLAMQMVDASSAFHRIYFLPADERPPENCEPVSLYKMLLERPDPQIAHRNAQTGTLWKVQVARLIAEAALRFDWPETRCQWGRDDVIFYTLQPSSHILGPFLKVEIESQVHGTNAIPEQPASGGRQRRTLLNLAFILLQIGLFKPIEPPPESWNDDQYRGYIIQEIMRNDAQILGDYITVVRQCAELASPVGEVNIDKEEFREKYYRLIVSPLRMMETNLLSLQKK
ncbi:hypothetical protein BKA67DRAFT_575565 [Truncatella angustata]|uniref:DUF7580 domain-containing protein n=1 Tax=Truncatella angustata TaxID=152316 RepID=A0A9P8UF06_9PEZI|nr:uncharacterized protein BKA67DRAFT_575565 [Truncatella angustata]KAH6648702.1 hypothetical protein BKA67DRAFT_575565 [Truncatella angustata]